MTDEHVSTATGFAPLLAVIISKALADAAKLGWESGRCVRLDAKAAPGPTGLAPGSSSTIAAAPRSKIDGSATGGTVVATLSAGGDGVSPASSPIPADATFTYQAPDESGKGGTVSLEARSRRGVAKADIIFTTVANPPYRIVGGLEDFQVDQVACDVLAPFTLTSSVGVIEFSGGLTGTYVFNGVFDSHYTGTYQINLPNGPEQPGTMVGSGGGSIAGQAGSGTENYTLTPATC